MVLDYGEGYDPDSLSVIIQGRATVYGRCDTLAKLLQLAITEAPSTPWKLTHCGGYQLGTFHHWSVIYSYITKFTINQELVCNEFPIR